MGNFQKKCALALTVAFTATSALAVPVASTSNFLADQTLAVQVEPGVIQVKSSPADRRSLPVKLPRRIRDLRDQGNEQGESFLNGPSYYPTMKDFRCVYLERLANDENCMYYGEE